MTKYTCVVMCARLFSLALLKEFVNYLSLSHLPAKVATALSTEQDVEPQIFWRVTAMTLSVSGLPPSSSDTAAEVT